MYRFMMFFIFLFSTSLMFSINLAAFRNIKITNWQWDTLRVQCGDDSKSIKLKAYKSVVCSNVKTMRIWSGKKPTVEKSIQHNGICRMYTSKTINLTKKHFTIYMGYSLAKPKCCTAAKILHHCSEYYSYHSTFIVQGLKTAASIRSTN